MALENAQYDTIMRAYNRRQYDHKHALDARRAAAYRAVPALRELDAQEADASFACAQRMIADGGAVQEALRATLAAIGDKRTALLAANGFSADYLQMTYDCPLCKDTGFLPDGKKCSCFQKAAIALLYEQSNHQAQYEAENFSTFSLDWYDKEQIDPLTQKDAYTLAQRAYDAAFKYAAGFVQEGGQPPAEKNSLLLFGPTGVGKTFLANCIAKAVIETIHSVVHMSAIEFFEALAAHQFRQEEDALCDSIARCDLLIIDDLGTETVNSFVVNSLCQYVGLRLQAGRGTVITTNLTPDDIKRQYLDRTFSRLVSGYRFIPMAGKDIRLLKQQL